MKSRVAISVLMSVYNTKEIYLRQAIESILNQSFSDFEFIIFDDHSDVRTSSILLGYQAQDSRINLIKNMENIGLTRNLNRGISLASGRYIARMDADDISLKKRLEIQFHFMEKHPHVDIVGGFVVDDEKKYICWKYFPQEWRKVELLFGNVGIFHPSAFFRADFFKNNELYYNEEYDKSQDYELWTRAFGVGKLAVCNKPILYYRRHCNQISMESGISTRQKELDAKLRKSLFTELISSATDEEYQQLLDIDKEIISAEKLSELFHCIVCENEKKGIYSTYYLKNELTLRWYWIMRGVISRKNKEDYIEADWARYVKTFEFMKYLLLNRIRRELCKPRKIRKDMRNNL